MPNDTIQLGVGTGATLPPGSAGTPEPPIWPPAAQWSMALIVALALALVGYRGWGLSRYSTQPLPLERTTIDLNEADEIDLQLIPGIGPTLARRIIEQRPYRSLEEVRRVSGIGAETLEQMRPHVRIGGSYAEMVPPPRVVRAKVQDRPPPAGKKKPPDAPIDINEASAAELMRLPGIGPTLAKRIVESRPFGSINELRRVKGIGVKTLDKLRPHVTAGAGK